MTEYQTHTTLIQSLGAEVSRLREVNAGLAQAARQALEAFPTLDEFFNRYVESIGGPYFGEAARIALMAVRELPRIEGALREALEEAPQPAAVEQELCPSCRNGSIYACTCTWRGQPAPRSARQSLTEGELDLILQKSPIKANYADLTALVRAVEKVHGIGGEA